MGGCALGEPQDDYPAGREPLTLRIWIDADATIRTSLPTSSSSLHVAANTRARLSGKMMSTVRSRYAAPNAMWARHSTPLVPASFVVDVRVA